MTVRDIFLVTGAGSGIGAALARRLAPKGGRLILHTGTNREALDALAQTCRSHGARVGTVLGDLRDSATLRQLADAVAEAGALDGLVFAAGYAVRGGVDSISKACLDRAFEAMPGAFLRLVQSVLCPLRARRGHIVAVSAFSAYAPHAGGHLFTATAPAKAAVEAAVRSLASELAPYGIPVNSISPGYVRKDAAGQVSSLASADWRRVTEAIPMGRLGKPDEMAATIAFLLSRDAAYITGQTLRIDGGLTL